MKNKNLIIITLVMFINALSYGTIIPILYPYASRFGINASGIALLFASFSLAQFIATPIIGRLSDKYGRKPLLLISLFGTSVSLAIFALAGSVTFLFVARILDGITGGNVSVAQAVISDSTKESERAKSFGLLGAAFGFGFVFGPAIGGFLGNVSLTAPFWFASALALFASILGLVILSETNKNRQENIVFEKLFDIKGLKNALFSPLTGAVLMTSFISLSAQNAMIIGFQSYTLDILKLSPKEIGILFTLFGLVGVAMQAVGIRILLDKIKSQTKILQYALALSAVIILTGFFSPTYKIFTIAMMAYGVTMGPVRPIVVGLISERTIKEDQGGILGFNQAYTSLAQIVGPLLAGIVVTKSTSLVFLMVSILHLMSVYPTKFIKPIKKKLDI